MSAPPHIARENGKKGGRPPGTHSLRVDELRAYIVERIIAEQEPIIDALIRRARSGDVQAIREALERSAGRVKEQVEITTPEFIYDESTDAALRQLVGALGELSAEAEGSGASSQPV